MNNGINEYLFITSIISGKKHVLEKLTSYSCRLYQTIIKLIESYAVMSQKFCDLKFFMIWHEHLGHPELSMMHRIINNSFRHPLKNQKILMTNYYNYVACSQDKLIIKPSFTKVEYESPTFLERIQGDICGPIHPPSGPFHYFMVLIDASTRWSHVCLLSTRNVVFTRLLAQII